MNGDEQRLRTIQVEALSRVEGEGGLHVRLRGDEVEDVQLRIFEPPRLFAAFLGGRGVDDVADIVARICGICPVAYQMSAVHALEAALGIRISPEIRRLRRLLYAANGSKATPCTCTSCTPRIFSASRAAWRWPAIGPTK